MVCLRNICINALHKGDNDDNNNNNSFLYYLCADTRDSRAITKTAHKHKGNTQITDNIRKYIENRYKKSHLKQQHK